MGRGRFGPNFQTLTDRLSDVQKVGPKIKGAICSRFNDLLGGQLLPTHHLPQGPNLLARHFTKRVGMPRSKRW